jgi:hypothetical protein
MGVLDDAIRDHLELRRRHGVAEDELLRQEEEALGPIRRDAGPVEAGAEVELAGDGEPLTADEEDVADEAHAIEAEDAAPPPEAVVHDALAADDEAEPLDAREPDVRDEEDPEALAVDHPEPYVDAPLEPKADHPPLEPERATGHAPVPSIETEEHEFEELDDDELLDDDGEPLEEPGEALDEDEDSEDVLEDTPDFLQETPEHDRLWFEQKPPRDFDFD